MSPKAQEHGKARSKGPAASATVGVAAAAVCKGDGIPVRYSLSAPIAERQAGARSWLAEPGCKYDLYPIASDQGCDFCGAPRDPDRGWMWACSEDEGCGAKLCWGCPVTVRQPELSATQPPTPTEDGETQSQALDRSRSARAPCDHCGRPRKAKPATRADRRCHDCHAELVYRKWCYRCDECVNTICASCAAPAAKASRQASASSEAVPAVALADSQTTEDTQLSYSGQLPSTGAIAEFIDRESVLADAAAANSALLVLLRRVPATFVASPRLWVPRQVRQQVAVALRELVAGAAATADAAPGDVQAEIAHLLCRAGPQLLLRYPPQQPDSEIRAGAGPDEVNGPGVLLLLRDRLLKARSGDQNTLINDLLADVATLPTDGQRAQPSTRDASGSISAATAQAATAKARNGSRRAAADLLIGGPPVPPGPDTDEQIHALFRRDPLTEEEQIEMRRVLEGIDALPAKKRLTVTPKLVGQQLASQKLAAGCGPSGWRNSHLAVLYTDAAGPATLAAWSNVWARGRISPWLASLWTSSLARPFYKNVQ